MNPSFMAMLQMKPLDIMNVILGLHQPKAKKETSINGRAFAPGHGHQQEVSSDEKEAKVQAHLAKLRDDVRARAGISKVYGKPGVDPVSPKVRKALDDAYQYRVGKAPEGHNLYNICADERMNALLATPTEDEQETYPYSDMVQEANEHQAQQAQAEAHAELKRERDAEIHIAITDRITAREAWVKQEMARNAATHTGEIST